MKELEDKIREYIEHLYNAKLTAKMTVSKIDDIYELKLDMPIEDIPTIISLQTDDENEFFCYICEEFRKRNYMRIQFYNVKRTN